MSDAVIHLRRSATRTVCGHYIESMRRPPSGGHPTASERSCTDTADFATCQKCRRIIGTQSVRLDYPGDDVVVDLAAYRKRRGK